MKHAFAVLMLVAFAALAVPAAAQPYCYETTLVLKTPVQNPDGVARVVFSWSTNATSGGAAPYSLTMTMKNAGGTILYVDVIMVNGVIQPMGATARVSADVGWDYNLNVPQLAQVINISDAKIATTTGTRYQIQDNASIPTDGQLAIRKTSNGITSWFVIDLVQSQQTKPDFDCNLTGDSPGATTVSVTTSPNPTDIGQNLGLVATVSESLPGVPFGQVVFRDGGDLIGSSNLNGAGVATLATSFSTFGGHTVTAQFTGNWKWASSLSPGHNHQVRVTTTTTIASSRNPDTVGKPVTFTAQVLSDDVGIPQGTVTWKDGGTTLGSAALDAQGKASLTTSSLPAGDRSIVAEYGGNAGFAPSASPPLIQQMRIPTATTLLSEGSPTTYGQPANFTATVTSEAGTPGGLVSLRENGVILQTVSLQSGTAAFSISTLAGGQHSLTADYRSSQTHAASVSAAVAHEVLASASTMGLAASANPSTYGQPVTFTATVVPAVGKSRGAGQKAGGTVTWKIGNTVIGSAALDGAGQARLTTSTLTVGQHSIVATFAGDADLGPSTSTSLPHRVRSASATSLVTSGTPSFIGKPVTFTATVTSNSGTPTGTVTFWRDGVPVPLGIVNLSFGSQATASLTTAALPAGTRSITAVYNGDALRGPSTSPTVNQLVLVPNLFVSLGADPVWGLGPLSGVDLTATVSGNSVGPIRYTFYCHRPDPAADPTQGIAAQFENDPATVKNLVDICNYPNPGTYQAVVIVERGGLFAGAQVTVTVAARPAADFFFSPGSPALNQPVQFTSTSAGQNLNHAWDFNRDGRTDSGLPNPSWRFPAGGQQAVTLTVTNAYGRSTKTLQVPVRDDTPHVTVVNRKYPGFFLAGATFENPLTIYVDWKGSPAGTVRVRTNSGAAQTVPFVGSSATYNLNTSSLPTSVLASRIEITPVSANGVAGSPRTEYVYKFPYPSWLGAALGSNGILSLAVPPGGGEVRASIGFDFPYPHIGASGFDTPSWVPMVGGRCGMLETFARVEGQVSSIGAGSLRLGGQVGATCAKAAFEGKLGGRGDFLFGPPRGLELTSATFDLSLSGAIKRSKKLEDVTPGIKSGYGWPVIGSSVRKIGKSDLEARVTLSVDLDATFAQKDGALVFRQGTGTFGLETRGTARINLGSNISVSAYISLGGSVTIGVPEPILRSAKVYIGAGVKATIDLWIGRESISFSAKYTCTWTNGGSIHCGLSKAGEPGVPEEIVLEVIDYDYKPWGRYAEFDPTPLERSKSARVPETMATTSLVTNLFPLAAPQLVDLGGGKQLLLWLHQDLADPTMQSSEISWSRFDGTQWSTPALIANDTRTESGVVAGVDAQGRVVAAWQRIKDPAFATPIEVLEDLPLFETLFEVVTSTFNPNSGTWSPVTPLTDDDLFDRDLRISRGPAGQLLLSWFTNAGGDWVSTAGNPGTLKHAIWNPGSASWSAPAAIAAGLVGVERHVAAWRGNAGVVMVSRDPDPLVEDDDVIEYWSWDGAIWSGPTSFAAGGFGHTSPQVQYDMAGQVQVLWRSGVQVTEVEDEGKVVYVVDALVQATLADPTPHLVRQGSHALTLLDVQFLSNRLGNLTLLWQQETTDGPADIFALVYDDETGTWSEDRRLTEEPGRQASAVSAVYGDDGVMRGAYLSTTIGRTTEYETIEGEEVAFPDVPVEEATDLRFFAHSLVRDLAVADEDLSISPSFPADDEPVTADLVVHNAGDFAMDDFAVALYVGEPGAGGTMVGYATVDGPFPAGATRDLHFEFDYPGGGGDLVAVVDPAELVSELTRLNNEARIALSNLAPDAIALADAGTGDAPLAVLFDGTLSSDPEGGELEYLWIFDDGSPNATGPQLMHSFTEPGEYAVTLIVTDMHGSVGTDTLAISVGPLGAGKAGTLLVDAIDDGTLSMSWGESCTATDFDYAIYEGSLGDFASHAPISCSTDGLTEAIVTPGEGDRYYLVVPRNGTREGSYGVDGGGIPRQPGVGSCAPQVHVGCGCSAVEQWGATAFASSQYSDDGWAAFQATGEPDTGCGDIPTAWAPLTPGVEPEWLEVGYATPVHSTGIDVYEAWEPGFVVRIEVRDTDGLLHEVWSGPDTTTECGGILNAFWPPTPYLVNAVRIHTQRDGWEEVDAVRLHGSVCE